MITFYSWSGVVLLILLPFTIFFLDTNTVLINAFAMCINACLLYLAENQQMLKVIIERSNQQR
jgi:hypothetical protein